MSLDRPGWWDETGSIGTGLLLWPVRLIHVITAAPVMAAAVLAAAVLAAPVLTAPVLTAPVVATHRHRRGLATRRIRRFGVGSSRTGLVEARRCYRNLFTPLAGIWGR